MHANGPETGSITAGSVLTTLSNAFVQTMKIFDAHVGFFNETRAPIGCKHLDFLLVSVNSNSLIEKR